MFTLEEKIMYNIRNITNQIIYVGCSDRKLRCFESQYPINNGMAYNSYLINDEKTVLIDTVDRACAAQFFENIQKSLNGKMLDFLIVQHMEPDHAALIENVVAKFPEVKIICNDKTVSMLKQFFTFDVDSKVHIVKEGDIFSTGAHELQFVMAPMVHWPEVMVTYDKTEKILFSADAFGNFGAINGNLFDDEVDWERNFLDEARRYYTNIVGKYGPQVQALLKKAAAFDIKMICPLHGHIIRENLKLFIAKYDKWSLYQPEENSVLIAYSSVYGGTESTVNFLANELAKSGVKNISVLDTSVTHCSYILAEAFKKSHIVVASTTYNAGIFESVEIFLNSLKKHNLQNRKFAVIGNGTWAPCSEKQIKAFLTELKNNHVLEHSVCIKSTMKEMQKEEIMTLKDEIVSTL